MVKLAFIPRSFEIPDQVLGSCVRILRAFGVVAGQSEADFLVVQRMLDAALSGLLDEQGNFVGRIPASKTQV